MTSRAHILTARSAHGLKRAHAYTRRQKRKGTTRVILPPRETLLSRLSHLRTDGVSAPDWVRAALWIFPVLGATGWLAARITDLMMALVLTGTLAPTMVSALCFKTAQVKGLISKVLPLLFILCGLSMGESTLVASILEGMRETGIIVPGYGRSTIANAKGVKS